MSEQQAPKNAPIESTNQSVDVATPTPTPNPEIDPKLIALERKQKAIRNKAQALKAQEEALKAREASLIPKEQLAKDPLAVLRQAGVTDEQLSAMLLGQQQKDPNADLIHQLKSEIDALKKGQEEQTTSAYQQALAQIRKDTEKLIANDPQFETIKETQSIGDVVELIERTWKEDGEYLSVEEAAKLVEEELLNEAIRIAQLKKVKEKLTPKAETTPESQPQTPTYKASKGVPFKVTRRDSGATTLTNQQATTRPLSARERAILAFKGELK